MGELKQFPAHIVAVYGIVESKNGQILLLKHRDKGVWMFPGGQVELGETLIDALVRETKEESNMDVTVDRLYCVCSNTSSYQGYNGYGLVPPKVVLGFICSLIGGVFEDSDETTEHAWHSPEEALYLLTAPDSKDKLKTYINFSGEIQYLGYVSKPEYALNLSRGT